MNKKEFVLQVERYHKREQQAKWQFFILAGFFLTLTFVPVGTLWLDEYIGEFSSFTSAILAGLCLGRGWIIHRGTEADKLLADALALLAPGKASSKPDLEI